MRPLGLVAVEPGHELPGIGLLKCHVGTCIPVVITSPLAVPNAGVRVPPGRGVSPPVAAERP